MGNLWGDLNHWAKAKFCFSLALKLQANWIEAHLGLGTAALLKAELKNNDWQTAHQHLLKAYTLRRGTPWNLNKSVSEQVLATEPTPISKELQAAWQSQLDWLSTQKQIPAEAIKRAQADRALYLEQPHYPQNPLQSCDSKQIIQTYQTQSGLAWYDDFLQIEALEQLLNFCQRSTFWHHHYQNAYLGAYLDDGFTCPLLYQIADALKEQLPELLGDLHLVYMWSFKCHRQGTGVAIHHDSALVNVNFWLTPDSASLDPKSGGICVYPQAPPEEWNLERFRVSETQINTFVRQTKTSPYCIPYKQNRVVIFNSRLFHKTQNFHFKPGYLNQRINITLLFGKRALRYHPRQPLPTRFWQGRNLGL